MFSTCYFAAFSKNRLFFMCWLLLVTAMVPQRVLSATLDSMTVSGGHKRTRGLEIELQNDNDMYLMLLQDQYYTNGLFVTIRKSAGLPQSASRELNRVTEFTLGHQMYNAYTAQIDSIEAVDRPIAAYLFLSAGRKHFFRNQSLGYSLEIGTLGKRAFGEVLQVQLHRLLNMYEASGWDYQLRNAWGATMNLHYNGTLFRRGGKVGLDLSVNPELSVGTHRTHLSGGPLLRLGRINRLSESAHFGARLQSSGAQPARELYLFYKPEAIFVGYDATLQGGMFVKDKGPVVSEPHRWQFSNQFGLVFSDGRVSLKIRYFFNTKEASRSMFRHQYGSLTLACQF